MLLNRSDLFIQFIEYLDSTLIEYVLLGDVRTFPVSINSDVDICLDFNSKDFLDFLIFEFLNHLHSSFEIVLCQEYEYNCYSYIILDTSNTICNIQLDFCSTYSYKALIYLRNYTLLSNSSLVTISSSFCFPVPADTIAFIYYFLKRACKNDFQLDHTDYLNSLTLNYSMLQSYFKDNQLLDLHLALISKQNTSLLNQSCANIRNNYNLPRQFHVVNQFNELKRLIMRILYPRGYCIAFLGPDGVGKTTLSNACLRDIEPAFRGIKRYHLRPYAFDNKKGMGDSPVTNPHGQPPRSFMSSVLKLCLFFIDYTIGYLITAHKFKIKANLVVFDRYFHDLLIDPKRYRFNASMWIAKLFGKLIQQPDLFIVLIGDPKNVWARKKEVSLEETVRQVNAYKVFAQTQKNSLLINTDRDLDTCRKDISGQIFYELSKRYE